MKRKMIKAEKFIPSLFLKLTDKTYPYGTEDILAERLIKDGTFPKDIQKDPHGNYFYKIGESRTIFASHLDTVTDKHQNVKHVFDGKYIKTDGRTTLGADDKAGVTILVWMMKHKVPGLYYFFIGEEVGCIGSGLASKYGDFEGNYDRILSFDRRDVGSIITHQSWTRSCSDSFADALCSELNISKDLKYIKDDGGVYTDSAEFVNIIPECTNVSVGYYSEHTKSEKQDIEHLISLSKACLNVNWESLPTERDTKVVEPKYSNHTSSSRCKTYSTYDDFDESDYGNNTGFNTLTSGSWSRSGKRSKGHVDKYFEDRNSGGFSYPKGIDEDEYFGKKSRRGKGKRSKTSKTYYDGINGLVDISKNETQYKWAKEVFSAELTLEELEIVKHQYIDNTSEYESFMFDNIKSTF